MNQFFGPHKLPFTSHEKRLSKGEHVMVEEGVIEYIFSKINNGPKYCVELGAGNGTTWSFTGRLLQEKGWSGLLVEGNPEWAKSLGDLYEDRMDVLPRNSFITAENINDLFNEAQVPKELDLLVIDIDGIDYYVWQKLEDYKPAVVSIEYNASWGPEKKFVIEYDAQFQWQEDDNYGASFASLLELGEKKGYVLAHCSTRGDNMIFIRKEFKHLFPELNLEGSQYFQPPQYNKFGRSLNGKGHPLSPLYSTALQRWACRLRYYMVTPLRKMAYWRASQQGIRVK